MKFKGTEKRLGEFIYPVHDEVSTGYLNPNVNTREQEDFVSKYPYQEQYEGVVTMPGE